MKKGPPPEQLRVDPRWRLSIAAYEQLPRATQATDQLWGNALYITAVISQLHARLTDLHERFKAIQAEIDSRGFPDVAEPS